MRSYTLNNDKSIKRIFITGNAGSGKTSLSIKLNKILCIPVCSLDAIVWKPRWKTTPSEERAALITEIIQPDEWIVDGVSNEVLKAADTIIFLDFSRRTVFWRLRKRNWKYLFRSRPGLPQQFPEILVIKKLIKIVWDFPLQVRPGIIEKINQINEVDKTKNIFHVRSNSELKTLLDWVKKDYTNRQKVEYNISRVLI